MLPQIHFNFGLTNVDRLYQIFLPLIPGSLLMAGMVAWAPGVRSFAATYTLNPYLCLGICVFLAYVAGCILYAVSILLAGIISGVLLQIFRYWNPERPNFLLSQRPLWRRVSAQFLGNLAPVEPQIPPVTAATVANIGTMFQTDVNARLEFNAQWHEWYNVLQDYLLRGTPVLNPDTAFVLLGVQATGWAMIFLSRLSGHPLHWSIAGFAWLFIFLGTTFYFFTTLTYATSDRLTYWSFVAQLLAETRASAAAPTTNLEKGPLPKG